MAKLDLLRNTNMVDFLIETHEQVNGSESASQGIKKRFLEKRLKILHFFVLSELKDRRQSVVEQLQTLKTQTEAIVKILEDEQVTEQIKNTR